MAEEQSISIKRGSSITTIQFILSMAFVIIGAGVSMAIGYSTLMSTITGLTIKSTVNEQTIMQEKKKLDKLDVMVDEQAKDIVRPQTQIEYLQTKK